MSWYSFEGNGNDVAGPNNATTVGTITYGTSYGVHGQGAHLAIGNNGSYYSFATPYVTTTTNNFTLAVWARTSAGGHVFDGPTSTWRAFGIVTFSNSVYASVNGVNGTHGFPGYGWHLWVIAFGADLSLGVYCDGVRDLSLPTWTTANLQALAFIGHYSGNGALDYIGDLDDAAVWKDRQLTQAEVTQLYNGGAGYTYP